MTIHPAGRALWYIENQFNRDIDLDGIASASGVSRFHLSRVFEARMGMPVMAYVRARRLSEAARRMADGAPDILSVALDAGYGSHEAFTRAFAAAFGMTPEQVRERRSTHGLHMQEAIFMDVTISQDPSPHRIETLGDFVLAGISDHYTPQTSSAIPSLWQRFIPWLDSDMPYRTGEPRTTYGVCYNQSENAFDYLCAVEVAANADLPPELTRLPVAAQTYAVFPHTGHVSGIRSTWGSIWDKWLPESGLKVEPAPFFEKYGPRFDGMTGYGGLEIWVPVQP